MVLERIRMIGVDVEERDDPLRLPDGAPQTFRELLDDAVRMWGDKIGYQQKAKRDWQRVSYLHVRNQSYEVAAGRSPTGRPRHHHR